MTSRGPSPTPRGRRKQEEAAGAGEPQRRAGGAALQLHAKARLHRPPISKFQPRSTPASSEHCPPGRGSQLLTKQGGAELLLSTLLFCGLTFFLTACCSFHCFGFRFLLNFVFPGGGEEEECLQSSVATHLTVVIFANVNQVWFEHFI